MKKCKLMILLAIFFLAFIAVPLSYASNYEEAVSYWAFDDMSYDDDFDGSSIETTRWGTFGTVSQTGGELHLSGTNSHSGINNRFVATGDFDVQLDFSDLVFPGTSGWKVLYLRAYVDGAEYSRTQIENTNGVIVYNREDRDGGATMAGTGVVTLDTAGKLRIAREGSTFNSYYWTGSDWSELSAPASSFSSTDEVVLQTLVYSDSEESTSADIDNFIIVNGELVSDSNGSNTGVINGATQTAGQYGNALSFDGNDDYVDLGNNCSDLMIDATKSVSVWANADSTGAVRRVIDFNSDGATNTAFTMFAHSNGNWYLGYRNTSGAWTLMDSTVSITPGAWTQLTAVQDGANMYYYVNGELCNSVSDAGIPTLGSPGNAVVGAYNLGDDQQFQGQIDDVGLWDRALDAYEIASIYDMGIEAYENLAFGADDLTLGYTTEELATLAQLYADGKAGLDPDSLVVSDKEWTYLSGDLPGDIGGTTYNIGDSWIYDGKYYIKLGSGLEGGAVPEMPPFAPQTLLLGFAGVRLWCKARGKRRGARG